MFGYSPFSGDFYLGNAFPAESIVFLDDGKLLASAGRAASTVVLVDLDLFLFVDGALVLAAAAGEAGLEGGVGSLFVTFPTDARS